MAGPLANITVFLGRDSAGQGLGSFNKRRIIERIQGLQGGIAAGAFEHAVLAAGSVEGAHHRMRAGAPPKGVEAATVFVLAGAGGPFISAVDNLPKAIGLRR